MGGAGFAKGASGFRVGGNLGGERGGGAAMEKMLPYSNKGTKTKIKCGLKTFKVFMHSYLRISRQTRVVPIPRNKFQFLKN